MGKKRICLEDVEVPLSVVRRAERLLAGKRKEIGGLRFDSKPWSRGHDNGILVESLGFCDQDRQCVVRFGYENGTKGIRVDRFHERSLFGKKENPESTLEFGPKEAGKAAEAVAEWLAEAAKLRVSEICDIPEGTHQIAGDSGGETEIEVPRGSKIRFVSGKGRNFIHFGPEAPKGIPRETRAFCELYCDAATLLVNTTWDRYYDRYVSSGSGGRVTKLSGGKRFEAAVCTGGDGMFGVIHRKDGSWIEVYW